MRSVKFVSILRYRNDTSSYSGLRTSLSIYIICNEHKDAPTRNIEFFPFFQHIDRVITFAAIISSFICLTGKYEDMGDYYRSWYEQDNFEQTVQNLFNDLAPLYDQLHAYVRRKLKQRYSEQTFPSSGHIPAHIFGM